jgi:5'(3')-deoxyribonucleotidase
MVYVDMDGVLANLYDFLSFRIINKPYSSTSEEERMKMREKVFRRKENFLKYFPEGPEAVFENLDPFEFNRTLIELINDRFGEYTILSRPSNLDREGTKRAKLKWVEKHLSFCPPKEVLLVQDKSANGRARNNILIDDWDKFLIKWKENGGIAIEYKANFFNNKQEVHSYFSMMFDKLSKVI